MNENAAELLAAVRAILTAALDDGVVDAEEIPEWKRIKRKARRALRRIFKEVEDEARLEIDPVTASAALVVLAVLEARLGE